MVETFDTCRVRGPHKLQQKLLRRIRIHHYCDYICEVSWRALSSCGERNTRGGSPEWEVCRQLHSKYVHFFHFTLWCLPATARRPGIPYDSYRKLITNISIHITIAGNTTQYTGLWGLGLIMLCMLSGQYSYSSIQAEVSTPLPPVLSLTKQNDMKRTCII